ncbi:serine/threonine protein kinase [Enhygromyxa salina]|uniref:Serine/threonine protein kinase n=1 Tax=Enhygromyxa salina TaxID=215803 RepID=A0A0C2CPA1_9BACT|nr:serine/threonine-protein kinase [Enhygromyxa salina]KIG11560.1 serine/threonine protein kinase [Enhygromyxa salina]
MDEQIDQPPWGLKEFNSDRFQNAFPIGEGRNASVYRAWDKHLERQVAFKKEPIDPLANFEVEDLELLNLGEDATKVFELMLADRGLGSRYTLLREGQLLARVDHPNVISVLDIGLVEAGRVAVVLPYLEAGTLDQQDLPRAWEGLLEIIVQICRGLAAIHEAGLLHRDLKPNNIIFGRDGRPRIADLGLGCAIEDADAMAEWVGTVTYMAPEVVAHRLRDQRDDLYALCMIAYQLFYRAEPFADAEAREQGRVLTPARRDMPRELFGILARGLAGDPDERWPDVPTLLRELERVREPKRPRWTWAAASIGGVAIAASVAVGFLVASRPAQADACEDVSVELEQIWDDEIQSELRGAFGSRQAGDGLDRWAGRWVDVRAAECSEAKTIGASTKPSPCSASLRDRFQATVQAFRTPHLREGLSYATVIAELPDPGHCVDHPHDAEWGYGGLLELRNIDVEVQALVGMGDLEVARDRQQRYMDLSLELRSDYGVARAMFWRGEIRRLDGELDGAVQDFERAYEDAWALGLGVFGAEVQMKLAAVAGARGEIAGVDAHALGARAVFAEYRPDRVAELLQVHGLALLAGPEQVRERGVTLLLRAVELREAQLAKHGGTRELLSAAHESYARGLLAVHRAGEALEYLDLALRVHQEEFGHGSWRTRAILMLKFSAFVEVGRLANAETVERGLLKLDADNQAWERYTEDAFTLANRYSAAGEFRRAAEVLQAGRHMASQHRSQEEVWRFDIAIEELVGG